MNFLRGRTHEEKMMIDAHQHFWDRNRTDFDHSWQDDLPKLKKNFLPQNLAPLLQEACISKSVFVQTQHNLKENHWALQLAEQHPFVGGVVGWIDLANSQCEEQLLTFWEHPKFVGIRHLTQDEPNDDFLVQSHVLPGLQVLERHDVPFDLLLHVRHLRHVPALARELPNLRMVIDHLAKPQIKDHQFEPWLPHFKAAAQFPNVYCKLSGLITEANWEHWSVDDIKPYVQAALEHFGPSRCMFGSDWPVCLLAGSYQQVLESLEEALGPLNPTERNLIFEETAVKFYSL